MTPKPQIMPSYEEFKEIYASENESGSFHAYNDFSIKIKFADRTLLRMKKGSEIAKIVTNLGESHDIHIQK